MIILHSEMHGHKVFAKSFTCAEPPSLSGHTSLQQGLMTCMHMPQASIGDPFASATEHFLTHRKTHRQRLVSCVNIKESPNVVLELDNLFGGLSQLDKLVSNCSGCCCVRVQHPKPLMPPDLPWQKVASDLFVWNQAHYLLVIDYFSRYVKIAKLSGESSSNVKKQSLQGMAYHRKCLLIMVLSALYKNLANLQRTMGSCTPLLAHNFLSQMGKQNEECKLSRIYLRNQMIYLRNFALLMYRSTPLPNSNYSPAELMMSRKLRTNLPICIFNHGLKPKVPNYSKLKVKECNKKEQLRRT